VPQGYTHVFEHGSVCAWDAGVFCGMEHLLYSVFVEVGRFETHTPADIARFMPPEEDDEGGFSDKGDSRNFQKGKREMLGEATDTLQDEPGQLYTGDCLCKNINFCQLRKSALRSVAQSPNEV